MQENIWDNEELVCLLKEGGVAVMPTDTIYGVVGRAESKPTVARIYKIRNRDLKKPCIILIGDISELEKFSIILSGEQKNKLIELWSLDFSRDRPDPTSVVLDCSDESLAYLHRGTQTLAFRLPFPQSLRNLLLKTGPLIATSANLEGLPPAQNISEAKKYFGNLVDSYIDGGEINSKHSKLVKLHKDGTVAVLRE